MSEVIDSKVVELKFNNKEFENNVKTSLSTLDKLKQSLNFDNVTKGVTALSSALGAINLKNISGQITELTGLVDQSVSPVMSAINTIGGAITSTIGGAITGTIAQIESGGMSRAFNIEAAKFSLQGLGIEWDTVSDSINNAVSGTAYGLDQAAKAAAVLSASGIGTDVIGTDVLTGEPLKELERDLKAVSGISAQTGQDFDRIADVFSTIANNGKVMTMQVRQFSTYGLNATADLAEYYGVATSDIEEMLKKGEIAADDFFDMMYNKYWENAGKANDTVTGVEANIKAALGRIGAAFISPIVENKGPLNQFLNSYLNAINTVAGKLKQVGSTDAEGNDISGKLTTYVTKNLKKYFKTATKWLDDFTKKPEGLLRTWRSVYRFLKGFFKLAQSGLNYLEKIGQAFNRVFPKGLPTYLLRIAKAWTEFTNGIYKGSKDISTRNEVFNRFKDIFEGIGGVLSYIKKLFKSAVKGFKDFVAELPTQPLKMFTEAFKEIGQNVKKFKASSDGFKNIFKGLYTVISNVATIWLALFQAITETMIELDIHPLEFIGKVFKTLTGGLETNDKKLKRLKNTFKIFTTVVGVLAKVLGGVILIAAKVVNIFLRLFNIVTYILSPLGDLLSTLVSIGIELGKKIFSKIKETVAEPFGSIQNAVEKARTAVENFVDSVTTAIDNFRENISESMSNVDFSKFENLQALINGVKSAFESAKESIGNALDWVSNKFTEAGDSMSDSDSMTSTLEGILGFFDGIAGAVITVKDNIVTLLQPAVDGIKSAFSDAFGTDTQDNIDGVNTKLTDTGKLDIFTTIKDNILTPLGDFMTKAGNALGIGEFFGDISKNLLDKMGLDEDASTYEIIQGSIGLVVDFIADTIIIILQGLGKIANEINNNYDIQTTLRTIASWLVGIDLTAIFLSIWDLASSIRNMTAYLREKNSYTLLGKFKSTMDAIGTLVLSIAGGILMMAGALAVIIGAISYAKSNGFEDSDYNYVTAFFKTAENWFTMIAILAGIFTMIEAKFTGKDKTTVGWKKGKGLQAESSHSALTQITGFITGMAFTILGLSVAFAIVASTLASAKKNEVDSEDITKVMDSFMTWLDVVIVLAAIIVGLDKFTKPAEGNKKGYGKALKFMSKIMLAFAASAIIMSYAFKNILTAMSGKKAGTVDAAVKIMDSMFVAMIGVVIAIGYLSAAINKNSGEIGQFTTFALDGAMLSFAGALLLMSITLQNLVNTVKNASKKQINKSLEIMGVMALGLATFLGMIAKKANVTNVGQALETGIFAIDMLAFAESINLMIEGFSEIISLIQEDAMSVDEIFMALLIMTAMGVGLTLMCNSVGKISPKTTSILSSISSLTVAVDMIAFGKSIQEMCSGFKDICSGMKGLDEDMVDNATTVMIACLTALASVVTAINASNAVKEVFGTTDTKAAVIIEAVSTVANLLTMWGFAASVKSLIHTFTGLVNDDKIDDLDSTKVTSLADMFSTVVSAYATMLTGDNLTKLFTIIGALTGAGIGAGGPTTAIGIGAAAGATIGSLLGLFVESLESTMIISNISSMMDKYYSMLNNPRIQSMTPEEITSTSEAFKNVVEAYAVIFSSSNKGILEGILSVIDKVLDGIYSIFFKKTNGYTANDMVDEAFEGFNDFIDNVKQYDISTKQVQRYAKSFSAILTAYADFAAAITDYNIEFGDYTPENLQNLNAVIKDILTNFNDTILKSMVVSTTDYSGIADTNKANAVEATKKSYESKATIEEQKAATTAAKWWYGTLEDEYSNPSPDTKAALDNTADASATATTEAIIEAFGIKTGEISVEKSLNSIGNNITAGVTAGMVDKVSEDKITNAAEQVIVLAQSGMSSKALIKSPSRLFKKKIGYNIIDGIIAGFTEKTSALQDSAYGAIDTLKSSFEQAKNDAISSFGVDTGTFTLTPVVDMSNVEEATGQINDLFNNQSMNFNSDISGIQSSMQQIQNQDPNADLMSAINGLKDNINNNYTSYNIDGITYDDGSNIASAVQDLISATNVQRRM